MTEDPGNMRYKSDVGGCCNNRGLALVELGRFEEAVAAYERAIEFQLEAVAKDPGVQRYRRFLDNHYYNLAVVYRTLKRSQDAVRTSLERKKLHAEDADELYVIAKGIAFAFNFIGESESDVEGLKERYLTLSASVLRDALDAGFDDQERMRRDFALDVFQAHPDFSLLLADERDEVREDDDPADQNPTQAIAEPVIP